MRDTYESMIVDLLLLIASVLLVLTFGTLAVVTLSLPSILTAIHDQLSSEEERRWTESRQASDDLICEVTNAADQ